VTRFASAVRWEFTTLRRQGFVIAAVVSGFLWLTVLLPMPTRVRPIVEPYILVGDVTIIGFFFIGASVFFEKQERTIGAVICSPLRFREYLFAKIGILMAISMVVGVGVVIAANGTAFHPLPVVAGIILGTTVMLLVGFASSLPFSSVSDWFLATTIPLAVLSLPILHLSGVWPHPVLYVIPTQGPLLLFGAAFDQVVLAPWQIAYALGYPALCAVALYRLARGMFVRYVMEGVR
jgi:fluoroquinolone transport system permease protein